MVDSRVELVVVNYKTYALVQRFIDSLKEFTPSVPFRVTLVDNETSDEVDLLNWDGIDNFRVIRSAENLGYAKACNLGSSDSDSEYIFLLNSDTRFINSECIDVLTDYMDANFDVGVVGPKQVDSYGRVTHAGIFGPGDSPAHRGWLVRDRGDTFTDVVDCLTVIGAAVFVRRSAWDAIAADPIFRKHWPNAKGAMPEHFLYYEETALCYAMPKFGYRVVYNGEALMVHDWHQTISNVGEGSWFNQSRVLFRALMDDWGIVHD